MINIRGNIPSEWKVKKSINNLKFNSLLDTGQKLIYHYSSFNPDSNIIKTFKKYYSVYQTLINYETVIACPSLILFKDGFDTEPIMIYTNNTYYLQEHEWWLTPIGKKVFKYLQDRALINYKELIWVNNLIERFFEHAIYDTKITDSEGMVDFIQSFNDRQIRLSTEGSNQES